MPVFVFFYCSLGFPFLYVCVCQPVCWLFSWDLSGLRLNGRLHDCHLELVEPDNGKEEIHWIRNLPLLLLHHSDPAHCAQFSWIGLFNQNYFGFAAEEW